MASRPTIKDVSDESGVSVATVDRVLNARAPVREETAKRVYEAAMKLGYHAAGLIEQRIRAEMPVYRLGFVLHKEKQEFYQNVVASIERVAAQYANLRIIPTILFASSQSASEYAELITKLGRTNQAVAAGAVDHPDVTMAVSDLKHKGIACFSLMNDFAAGVRQGYVGLNNLRVGRGTAWMISKVAKPSKVAIFVGGNRWHGHDLRETGFRSYFREYNPEFQILDTLVNLETRQVTYEATLDLLDRHPDLRALFCAGGGMEGALQAIKEVRKPNDLVVVVNENTAETRKALQERYLTMANVTPLDKLMEVAIQQMIDSIQNGLQDTLGQSFIQQEFLFPEML